MPLLQGKPGQEAVVAEGGFGFRVSRGAEQLSSLISELYEAM